MVSRQKKTHVSGMLSCFISLAGPKSKQRKDLQQGKGRCTQMHVLSCSEALGVGDGAPSPPTALWQQRAAVKRLWWAKWGYWQRGGFSGLLCSLCPGATSGKGAGGLRFLPGFDLLPNARREEREGSSLSRSLRNGT
jgi:hypothetical protein